ncbi:MAG: PEP/pyruvate-binding domain-containing protein [Polyangiales bacterium]
MARRSPLLVLAALAAASARCSSGEAPAAPSSELPNVTLTEGACTVADATMAPDSLRRIQCNADFNALASAPLDATLPGARSVKVIYDRTNGNLYFQNSVRYQIHYAYASRFLSGNGMPVVPTLATFNTTEYFSPDRRFVLGAVTHYEGPRVWALELSPYDTASAELTATLYNAVKAAGFFGPALTFHPSSDSVARMARSLPSSVRVATTDQIYARIDYQPLTLGRAIGRLRFARAATLASQYLDFEDIVVLDEAPNDISVVRGLITQTFQTPLSHINVLAQNRHTPNLGLRGAMTNPTLRALEGRLVELVASAEAWTVREVTTAEAETFWAANRPAAVTLPPLNLTEQRVLDIAEVTPEPTGTQTLRGNIVEAVRAFGGKAAQYSILARTERVNILPAFAIPVYFYDAFMRDNGLYDRMTALQADARFRDDPAYRSARLGEFHDLIMRGTVPAALQAAIRERAATPTFRGRSLRFRTSTNSEDLDGFPCAGCYESHTGDPAQWDDVLDAIRETYASAWSYRTYQERSYYGVDHRSVGMALLVHHYFPEEAANGVAVTSNPFDAAGLDPAFYVNVQFGGDSEVVHPPPGVSSDQFLYYFSQPGQPTNFIARSSLIPDGHTVLTPAQTYELGTALNAIHQRFSAAYGPAAGNTGWYAMDVEFKFDADGQWTTPRLVVKQARPYPGRGQ